VRTGENVRPVLHRRHANPQVPVALISPLFPRAMRHESGFLRELSQAQQTLHFLLKSNVRIARLSAKATRLRVMANCAASRMLILNRFGEFTN
jgi:hypothetical protein